MGVGVLVPHADDDVGPRMTAGMAGTRQSRRRGGMVSKPAGNQSHEHKALTRNGTAAKSNAFCGERLREQEMYALA